MVKIQPLVAAGKITPEQQIAFLAVAERRAQAESQADLLREIQGSLADLYIAVGNLKQASEYLRGLIAGGATGPELARLQGQLLTVYLGLGNIEEACGLLGNYLSAKDLDLSPEGAVARCVETYLSNPNTANPAGVLQSLAQIPVSDPRALQAWQTLLGRWTERYAKAKKPEDNDRANN
jgi:tetratricopeptide (TPR) repeat protein